MVKGIIRQIYLTNSGTNIIPLSGNNTDNTFFKESTAKLSGILSAVFTVLRLVGILLLVYAIYETIIAFQTENTESKIRAVSLIVVSIVIILLKSILNIILKGWVQI